MANKFYVPQLPGEALKFLVSFSADWENRVDIHDQDGNLLLRVDIDDPKPYPLLEIGKNETEFVRVFLVTGWYKMARDGRFPWWPSKGSMTRPAPGHVRIGYQDQDHGAVFDNAVVAIEFL